MITTTAGLFDSFSKVSHAVEILRGCGFSHDEISVFIQQKKSHDLFRDAVEEPTNLVGKQRFTLPLDLNTLMIDGQSLFVKGIGSVIVAGPLAFLLARTTDQRQSGDLTDALGTLDISGEEAESYAEGVRRGGTLLTVSAASYLSDRAEDVLLVNGAVDMRQRVLRWRQQGWDTFSPNAELYTVEEMAHEQRQQAEEQKPGKAWHPYDREFRSHFYFIYPDVDFQYEKYAPAYRYGYQLASDERYDKKDWCGIETQAQQAWERQYDTDWVTVVDAISYGFCTGRTNYAYRSRS